MRAFLYTLLISFAFSVSPAFAAEWTKLGARDVNFKAEVDTIKVGATEGTFSAIKLDVNRGGIVMYDIVVTFGNGETFSPKTRLKFSKGSLSRTIDLPGTARVIKKVQFVYKSQGKKRNKFTKARILLFGKKVGMGASSKSRKGVSSSHPDFPGWKHLGSRKVSPKGEKDTISVKEDGRIRSFLFAPTGGAIEVYDIVVHFGNGEKFSPKTRLKFGAKSKSRNIDLPGKSRRVLKIDFYYKSNSRDAKLHVFGKN